MKRFWIVLAAFVLTPLPTMAQLIVRAESPTIVSSPSSTVQGLLDIFVEIGPEAPQLSYYYMTVNLIGPAGVSFAGIQETNVGPNPRPRLFPTREAEYAIGSTPTSTRMAVDINPTSSNVTAFDGAGLFRIVLDVAPGTLGQWTLDIDTSTVATTTFGRYNPISDVPFTAFDGLITVVPEPGAIILLALTGLLLRRSGRLA